MQVTGIPIPFNLFQLRGQMGPDGRVLPGATAWASTKVLSIPTFGPLLVLAGLANNWWQKLLAVGTYVTRPYPLDGPAVRLPDGLAVETIEFQSPTRFRDGHVTATFNQAPGARRRPTLLLVDEARTEAVALDYHAHLHADTNTVTLTIPKGIRLPDRLNVIVILDVVCVACFVLRDGPRTTHHV
jgi:hypothetical protein